MLLCHLRLGCLLVLLGAGNQPRAGHLIVVKANDFVGGKCLEVVEASAFDANRMVVHYMLQLRRASPVVELIDERPKPPPDPPAQPDGGGDSTRLVFSIFSASTV